MPRPWRLGLCVAALACWLLVREHARLTLPASVRVGEAPPPVPRHAAALPPPPPPQPSPVCSVADVPEDCAASGGHYAERPADAVMVGLNKKVFRFVDERNYSCPAMRGAPCLFTTLPAKFGKADAIIDVLKDPRKVRPIGFKVKKTQLRGVIISEQDKAKQYNAQYKRNAYDFEIGYNKKDSRIWRPFMCNELSRKTNVTIAETLLRGPPPSANPRNKTGVLAAWVSNCVAWRMDYLRRLRKVVPLDSFGKCLNNNKTCAKSGASKCDRVELAGSYRFVFAFENTEEPHYVTEKVYTGLRSGAVPIYKGAPEVLEHVPKGSIILADEFASPEALGHHLMRLVDDDAAYRAHFAWDLAEFGRRETVARCPWQCRVCEMLLDRRGAAAQGEHGGDDAPPAPERGGGGSKASTTTSGSSKRHVVVMRD